MTKLREVGDELEGDRIAVRARDIAPVRVERGSSAHRIQTTILHRSAYCIIEMPLKVVQSSREK